MEIAALQAFCKVVQTGSFTRAAEALGTHKARLSRTISQLERELGARLLERTTRSLSLTEVGRDFHRDALAILSAVEDARLTVAKAQAEPRGTLRLTCGVEFGMLAVHGWINRYLTLYPQMKVEAEITGRLVDVVHEGFDLAIRVGPLRDSTLVSRRLGQMRYAIYAAPSYLSKHGEPETPGDLHHHEHLSFSPSSTSTAWRLSRDGTHHSVTLRARYRVSNIFALRDAAVAGIGVALLPRIIGDPEVAQERLTLILPGWTRAEVPISAVYPSARYRAPKVKAFIDLAEAALASIED